LKPITVGDGPDAIAVSPDGRIAYVANDSNTVTPIRIAGNKALKPVKVGKQPSALVFTPNGRTLYVVDYTTDGGPGLVTPVRTCAAGLTARASSLGVDCRVPPGGCSLPRSRPRLDGPASR
jgi:YVTN family beta-propeller protein